MLSYSEVQIKILKRFLTKRGSSSYSLLFIPSPLCCSLWMHKDWHSRGWSRDPHPAPLATPLPKISCDAHVHFCCSFWFRGPADTMPACFLSYLKVLSLICRIMYIFCSEKPLWGPADTILNYFWVANFYLLHAM